MTAARFSRHNQPVTCRGCGKLTTEHVRGADLKLCAKCQDEAGLENEHSDNGHPEPVEGCPTCEGRS